MQKTLQELIGSYLELGVVDGVVLPHLKMQDVQEQCGFLNREGRCSIHPARPGICRIFPLGRYYENHTFQYFLQVGECAGKNPTKVKVAKWIDTPNLSENQAFVQDWHELLMQVEALINDSEDDAFRKNLAMFLLNTFYFEAYDGNLDFYVQYRSRKERFRQIVPNQA